MGTAVAPTQPGSYPPSPLPNQAKGRLRDVFFVQVDFPNVPIAGVQTPGNFAVDADADFVITGGAQRVTTTADRTTVLPDPAVFVALTRSAAGRTLMNLPVPISALLGTAQRPARWEAAMYLRANSNLAITVTSLQAAAVFVQLTFWGYKVFNT